MVVSQCSIRGRGALRLVLGLLSLWLLSGCRHAALPPACELSTVLVTVTDTIADRFGHHGERIPMGSTIVGTVEGTVRRGQTRIPIRVHTVALPDNTDPRR